MLHDNRPGFRATMEAGGSLELLRSATYEQEPEDDDVSMAEPPSHHEADSPSDGSDSSPSEDGPETGHDPAASSKLDAGTKKRKQSSLDADGNPKPVKKRASQACEICRSRKVRCDSEKRHPCTNCADMGLNCHIPESKRRRRHLHAPAANHSILPNPPPTVPSKSCLGAGDDSALPAHAGDSPFVVSCSPQLHRTYGGGPVAEWQWGPEEEARNWRAFLPAFVKSPSPGKVNRAGLRYLRVMGALDLPTTLLEKQLVLAYIEHVHPDFPVLDLHDFLRRISDRSGGHGQVSLLLYQSVMFAASAFVKTDYLAAVGFASRRALRRAIFHAAKCLHDLDYENDKFTLVQSTLLLSFWYEAPDDSKETWHWSGIAISQAQALGLHRSTMNSSVMDPIKRKQRRRIWWSCVMRDRQIGLGMSRLIRIKDEDFDITELQEDDFQIETMDDNPMISQKDCPLIYDMDMQAELAEMSVQKFKLYVLVGHVLQAVHSFQVATSNRTRSVAAIIEGNLEVFEGLHRKLVAWADALPMACRYRTLQPSETEQGRTAVVMQRSLLHMLYHTTIGKVYHPLVRPPRTPDPKNPAAEHTAEQHIYQVARLKCKEVVAVITRMAGEMHQFGLDRFFPTTGVTVIMPAMLMHLTDVNDPVEETREEALRGFDKCMSVLNTLRETYAAAEYAATLMENVIRNKPGVERPAPALAPAPAAAPLAQGPPPPSLPLPGQAAPLVPRPRPSAYAAMIQPRELDNGQREPSQATVHPGLNEMGLANLPVMSQSPMVGGLTSQAMQMPSASDSAGHGHSATFPNTAALLTALNTTAAPAPAAALHQPWPVEIVSHVVSSSDGGSGSLSPENTPEGYMLVSGGNSSHDTDMTISPDQAGPDVFGLGTGGDISAEGLNFPQLADDGWQNWLNLPDTDYNGDNWSVLPEHIDPGALNPVGSGLFG